MGGKRKSAATQLQNRGAVATGLVRDHPSRKKTDFVVGLEGRDWTRSLPLLGSVIDRCFPVRSRCTYPLFSHPGNNRVSEFCCLCCATDIASAHLALRKNRQHCGFDLLRGGTFVEVAKHEDAGLQQSGRISYALASDVGSGTVYGLEN